jgi:antitoxin component YwqK of YwqJK toxin-antitoxin module
MRPQSTIFILLVLFGCKTEYRKVIKAYSNGKTRVEYVYPNKNDQNKYDIIEYYQGGQVSFKGTVDKNKFVGVKRSFYENGNLKQVDSLTAPCDLNFCCCDGVVFKYYSNGKSDQTYENRNGVANGLVKLYGNDSSGKPTAIYTYLNDRKNGAFTRFYQSGERACSGTYRNDTLVDHIYYFEKNGDTLKINYTWQGNEDFPSKKWLRNGEIFYATYLDSSFTKALYVWTDKSGKELRREIVSRLTGGKWITANRNWLTPN